MEDKKLEINEKNLKAAFEVADGNTKKVLEALFGNQILPDKPKPSLDDYTTIKTYEDACEALDISPILSEDKEKALCAELPDHYDFRQYIPKHIIAQMKLEVICRALWGGEVNVYPDPEGKRRYWYPWFRLYTKGEIDCMSDEEKRCLLPVVRTGTCAGFGCPYVDDTSSYTDGSSNYRLYLDTEEKAKYFGKQFLKLWAEAIAFNFSVGDQPVSKS